MKIRFVSRVSVGEKWMQLTPQDLLSYLFYQPKKNSAIHESGIKKKVLNVRYRQIFGQSKAQRLEQYHSLTSVKEKNGKKIYRLRSREKLECSA